MKKKGVSRLRTRLSIVFLAAGLLILLVSMTTEGWLMTILGIVFCVAAMLILPLGCPNCGKKIAPKPQWSEPGKYHCPYCGGRMFYDDEEE